MFPASNNSLNAFFIEWAMFFEGYEVYFKLKEKYIFMFPASNNSLNTFSIELAMFYADYEKYFKLHEKPISRVFFFQRRTTVVMLFL